MKSKPTIPVDIQNAIRAEIARCHAIAKQHYKLATIPVPNIQYDLKGTSAGQWWNSRCLVRFNAVLLIENTDHFIKHTVPHEIAHQVKHLIWPHHGKAHGKEWRSVAALFGGSTARCHTYDVSTVRPLFEYHCGCPGRILKLKPRQHSRQQNNPGYRCASCKQLIVFGPPPATDATPKLITLPAKPGSTAPSAAQLTYAKSLATKAGINLPATLLADRKGLSDFIATHSHPKQTPTAKPTQELFPHGSTVTPAQQGLIQRLMKERGLAANQLPSTALNSKSGASEWIGQQLNKPKPGSHA